MFNFLEVLTDEAYATIFKWAIMPAILPVGFAACRKDVRFFKFYHPAVMACQLRFGQVPPELFFTNLVKARGIFNSALEYDRLSALVNKLPSFDMST